MNRTKILMVTVPILMVVAFLVGLVPQYLKAEAFRNQLTTANQQLQMAQDKLDSGRLDLLIGYVYLQTNLKNYGLASEIASKFFDAVGSSLTHASNPKREKFLESAVGERDAVTAGLAKGDPGTLALVQDLFSNTLETSQLGWR